MQPLYGDDDCIVCLPPTAIEAIEAFHRTSPEFDGGSVILLQIDAQGQQTVVGRQKWSRTYDVWGEGEWHSHGKEYEPSFVAEVEREIFAMNALLIPREDQLITRTKAVLNTWNRQYRDAQKIYPQADLAQE